MITTEDTMETDIFEALYRERHAPMVRLARLIVGSQMVAEELVHDTFLRVRPHLERVDTPNAYLRTAVVNACRSWLERSARERRHYISEPLSLPPEYDETWKAVQALPPRYRSVLALRFYEDMSEADIASALGISVGTVKSTIHRGLDKLRKELTHDRAH